METTQQKLLKLLDEKTGGRKEGIAISLPRSVTST